MLIPLLLFLLASPPDTLRVYNSHGHEMVVVATVGDRSIELGVVQPGDTAAFEVTIPAGVTQLHLRAYPPTTPLSQITTTLDVRPGRPLFWSFEG